MKDVQKMERMFNRSNYGVVEQLCYTNEEVDEEIPGRTLEVIHHFPRVFEEPKGLAPPRYHDHHIPLIPTIQNQTP